MQLKLLSILMLCCQQSDEGYDEQRHELDNQKLTVSPVGCLDLMSPCSVVVHAADAHQILNIGGNCLQTVIRLLHSDDGDS